MIYNHYYLSVLPFSFFFFFFNDTATTEIYTLSLHDALPISCGDGGPAPPRRPRRPPPTPYRDRKSTRLNSSHSQISYAVFCLKKKKKQQNEQNYVEACCTELVSSTREDDMTRACQRNQPDAH